MRQTDYKPLVVQFFRRSTHTALAVCCLSAATLLAPPRAARAQANPNAQQPRAPRTKRITPLRSSDTAQGSRVTITSDDGALNDYSAYRSGDRFIVVIPQAEGSGGAGVRGRGFEGAQVTRRGKDLVYTFKLEPGATARVNQRFNRLDVQFTAPKQGGTTQGANTSTPVATPAPTPRAGRTPPELAGAASPTPVVDPTPALVPTPDQPAVSTAVPDVMPTPSVEPAASPTAAEQIAQVQPTAAAPVGVAVPSSSEPAPGRTLGTTIINNWPWIIAALIALGLGLLFVGRLGSRRGQQLPPAERTPAALKETTPTAVATTTAATAATVAAAQPSEAAQPVEAETAGTPVVTAKAGEEKGVEVAAAPADTERAGAQIKKLLAGQPYDESVINAEDTATRQFVAAELSAALVSRNAERNERARTAFLRYGYFDDATRDLQSAESPGRRASAARSLSLVRGPAVTPHLVAALEDPSADVRRAAVEALAELRDPAAADPLEALLWREKSRLVPRALIQRALEACMPEEDEETLVTASAPTATETAATETAATEAAVTETAPPEVLAQTAAPAEEASAAGATQPAPAVEEATPAVAEISTPAPVEEAAETSIVAQPRAVEEPAAHVAAPSVEAVEARESAGPETAPVAEPQAVRVAETVAETTAAETAAVETTAAESAASRSAAEPVYTFDESEAAAWAARREGRRSTEVEAASRGVGRAESREAERAAEMPAYIAPEFAVPRGEAAADEWVDVEVGAKPATAAEAAAEVEESRRVTGIEPVAAGERETHAAATETSFEIQPYKPEEGAAASPLDLSAAEEVGIAPASADERGVAAAQDVGLDVLSSEKGLASAAAEADELSIIPKAIQLRLDSADAAERAESVLALTRLDTDAAYNQICAAFDDPSPEVRDAAARALYESAADRAEAFTRALREAPAERRRNIGAALSSSGLAEEAIGQLTGESRERTYDAFSLLFLMAKAGETAPLIRAIESHPDNEVRLAVVKLLALSGQQEVLPSFRRLAVRGSLPTDVRSAVMEAIYQISSSGSQPAAPNRPR